MKYVSFLCVLFSGLLSTVALGKPDRSSHVATQAEVEQDSFLRGTARNLEKSDVVLSVIIYKIVSTDQGTTHRQMCIRDRCPRRSVAAGRYSCRSSGQVEWARQ